jgi:chorismate mutase
MPKDWSLDEEQNTA